MSQIQFGIVGTGMIAGVIADAIAKSSNARLTAVSSRRIETARTFVAERSEVAAVQGIEGLLARPDVDAIYVATPTVAKEAIALAAIQAGKHVLVDKPFADQPSLARMTQAAEARGVVFMDATHFVHHPRTAMIQELIPAKIGSPRSLHTAFYFPFSDRCNIRFDPKQEPMTALGDMAWYSMRAVVEYLQPKGQILKAVAIPERDPQTGAIIRISGVIAFEGGEVSTFDVGYTAGTVTQDLQLLGTTGIITMNDFVLDWTDSFAFKNPDIQIGFSHRTGMATPKDATFIATLAKIGQEVLMIEDFAELVVSRNPVQMAHYVRCSLATQGYLDALWMSAEA